MSSIKNFLELPTDKQIGETQHFFLIRDINNIHYGLSNL